MRVTMGMRDQNGLTLVETLVSAGILSVMLGATVSATVFQAKQNAALTEKLAASDFYRAATMILSTSTCNQLFNKPGNVTSGSLTFDTSTVKYPFTIDLSSLPNSSSDNLVSLTQPEVSPLTHSVRILPAGGIQLKVLNEDTAELNVYFDQTKLVRPIKDARFRLSLQTLVSGTNRTIVGCQGAAAGSVTANSLFYGGLNCVTREPEAVVKGPCGIVARVNCEPGEVLVSGGTSGAGNVSLQSSSPVVSNGKVIGWGAVYYDPNSCSINGVRDGTTRPGSNPCFAVNGSDLCGSVQAVCCK